MKIDPVKAGGLCNVFTGQHDSENVKSTHVVKSIVVESEATWYKVFDDKEHGIAGYMTHEFSDLFNQ
ncbi:MAG TPA: hypothetical protein EYG66_01395 [Mariprofundaceae bacterium]|nr:hypothetical protein [Mariprofundaceae bacterium]